MATTTARLLIGPADHGRRMTVEEFMGIVNRRWDTMIREHLA